MKWEDEAIILSSRKFNERDLIVTVFCKNEGIFSGIVKAGQSKTKIAVYQQGNIVTANWRARLEDQLGTLTAETQTSISAQVINDRLRLQALLSIVTLVKTCLAERDPHTKLYLYIKDLLEHLVSEDEWLGEYVFFEIALLRECGFGLDLSECAVTGMQNDLQYVSPKSGRAVSSKGAVGYENKLLKLPKFLLDHESYEKEDIVNALKICGHFFAKNIYDLQHKYLPDERQSFVRKLSW